MFLLFYIIFNGKLRVDGTKKKKKLRMNFIYKFVGTLLSSLFWAVSLLKLIRNELAYFEATM